MSEPADPGRLQVEQVARFLRPHGIEVRFMPADTSTAASAAATLDTEVGSIAKSILFMVDSEPVLALVAGDRTVNTTRLTDLLGARSVRLARSAEVTAETGYAVGGVPPVAHRRPLRVLMDHHLLRLPVVYAAAGSNLAVFAAEPAVLARLARAEVAEFTE